LFHWFLLSLPFYWQVSFSGNNCAIFHFSFLSIFSIQFYFAQKIIWFSWGWGDWTEKPSVNFLLSMSSSRCLIPVPSFKFFVHFLSLWVLFVCVLLSFWLTCVHKYRILSLVCEIVDSGFVWKCRPSKRHLWRVKFQYIECHISRTSLNSRIMDVITKQPLKLREWEEDEEISDRL